MINSPKTLDEAIKHYKESNYSQGYYVKGYCAHPVMARNRIWRQCSRCNGHGPNKLYCKQHSRKVLASQGET